MKRVAIIGGGVAGLSAALSLEQRGIPSVIIEREAELGGLCAELGCKGVVKCVRCDVCLVMNMVRQAKASPGIERIRGSELSSVSGKPGDFRLTIRRIDNGQKSTFRAGAIICATGGEPFDARLDKRLGYGEVKDVITSSDLELQLNQAGKASIPSTGQAPRKVAFIMCVGSRDEHLNAGYCSKACCKYSFKLGQALKSIDPECEITFLFMDWRLYDPRENVRVWASGERGVRLVRSRPAEVVIAEGARPEVRFASEGDKGTESEVFDLVVLSVGIRPSKDAQELSRMLQVEADVYGFIRNREGEPCSSTREGIFLAGTCSGPKEIVECAKDGATAASKAVAFLGGLR
jgi:heterodisulfide reductase subunit A2